MLMSPIRLIPDRSEALDTPSRGVRRPYPGAVLGKGWLENADISPITHILSGEDQDRPDFCELASWAMNLGCLESARLDSLIGPVLGRPNQGPGRRVWSRRSA
jgi:hypothetical protein